MCSPSDKQNILKILTELLLKPDLTLEIARSFRRILPLLINWLPSFSNSSQISNETKMDPFETIELVGSAFSKLLPICPQCLE
jgi:hypothetical protein